MAPTKRPPFVGPFTSWRPYSRGLQALLTLIVLCTDAYVISKWNTNQYQLNALFSDASKLNTDVLSGAMLGNTPFTGVALAASLLTLATICYDMGLGRRSDRFWNLYSILVLEFVLAVFWVASFAGLAGYVDEMAFPASVISTFVSQNWASSSSDGSRDESTTTKVIVVCCTVMAVLGALIFGLAVINVLTMISQIVMNEKWEQEPDDKGQASLSPAPKAPGGGMMNGDTHREPPSCFDPAPAEVSVASQNTV